MPANSCGPQEVRPMTKGRVSSLFETISEYYRVTIDSLRSTSRSRTIAFPRQMAMYLARTETDLSYPQIGEQLGHRDHTTILYGYEKISELQETDASVRRDLLEIKALLYDSVTA